MVGRAGGITSFASRYFFSHLMFWAMYLVPPCAGNFGYDFLWPCNGALRQGREGNDAK